MKKNAAFSLVEVTLALGVAAFCLLAIFGLIPIGLNVNQAASEQAAAMNIASALISDARSTPQTATQSVHYALRMPGVVTSGPADFKQNALYLSESGEVVTPPNARYLALVSLTGAAPNRVDPSIMHVMVTWPAQANAAVSTADYTTDRRSTLKNLSGSAETIAALNRN